MRKPAIAAMILSGAALTAVVPANSHPDDIPRTVLAIVAHPDDELFIAPALAGEVRSGSRVIIIYATNGDAGPGVSGMEPGEDLALARRKEAHCAAEALGAVPVYLNFGDGKLANSAGRTDSVAAELREQLREQIISRRPEMVMTWGPDGGYGHPDHRMVSALVSEVVQEMAPDTRPTLLYSGIVKGRMPDDTPFGRWAGTDPELLTYSYSYNADDIAKSNTAAQCHKTQFDEASRVGLIPFLDTAVWQGEVAFREAF